MTAVAELHEAIERVRQLVDELVARTESGGGLAEQPASAEAVAALSASAAKLADANPAPVVEAVAEPTPEAEGAPAEPASDTETVSEAPVSP